MEKPNLYKDNFKESRFHHISTDEVYGSLGDIGLLKNKLLMLPILLILQKAASDMFRSYYETYGLILLLPIVLIIMAQNNIMKN